MSSSISVRISDLATRDRAEPVKNAGMIAFCLRSKTVRPSSKTNSCDWGVLRALAASL